MPTPDFANIMYRFTDADTYSFLYLLTNLYLWVTEGGFLVSVPSLGGRKKGNDATFSLMIGFCYNTMNKMLIF